MYKTLNSAKNDSSYNFKNFIEPHIELFFELLADLYYKNLYAKLVNYERKLYYVIYKKLPTNDYKELDKIKIEKYPENLEEDIFNHLIKYSIPDSVFHITDKENVPNILKNGLKIGSNVTSNGDNKFIYLTSDWEQIVTEDPDFFNRNLSILEIDVKDIKENFTLDEEFNQYEDEWAWKYNNNISFDRIKYLGNIIFKSNVGMTRKIEFKNIGGDRNS